MINWLHTNIPEAIIVSLGPIQIHWYSLCIVAGVLAGIAVSLKLADFFSIKKNDLLDLYFWMILAGIVGARLYHIFIEYQYYLENPIKMLFIWRGGLAIHGVLIGCALTLVWFAKTRKIELLRLMAIFAPAAPIAQAIGRWGNYFNQENYGTPTELPWGIPIDLLHRIPKYFKSEYYHPAFLYESIGSLIIFLLMLSLTYIIVKKQKLETFYYTLIITSYLTLYSILRFSLEFFRVDETIVVFGVRWPMIMSVLIILACFGLLACARYCQKQKTMLP